MKEWGLDKEGKGWMKEKRIGLKICTIRISFYTYVYIIQTIIHEIIKNHEKYKSGI